MIHNSIDVPDASRPAGDYILAWGLTGAGDGPGATDATGVSTRVAGADSAPVSASLASSSSAAASMSGAVGVTVSTPANADREAFTLRDGQLFSGGVTRPTRAEMHSLRQEFSVVAHLERSKKKSWVVVAIGLAALAVLAVGVVVYRQQAAESSAAVVADHQGEDEAVYAERVLYATPKVVTDELAPPADEQGRAVQDARADLKRAASAKRVAKRKPTHRSGDAAGKIARTVKVASKRDEQAAKSSSTFRKMSADEYRALTQDDLGKGEVKLDFDPYAAAKKHEEEQERDRAAKASERSVKVAEAFGKKRHQFRRCTDQRQERVKVVFSVLASGKVSKVTVSNTASADKANCVEKILARAIFPTGPDAQTYSQTLVL